MSKKLNESPVIRRNEEYIERLKKRKDKLQDKLKNYRTKWIDNPEGGYELEYINIKTNRKISEEQYKQLKKNYYDAVQKLRSITNREDEYVSSNIVPLVISFIVMDKKRNPDLYPEWLSLDVNEYSVRAIYIQPHLDLKKILEESADYRHVVKTIERRIYNFVKNYTSESSFIVFKPEILNGIDDYIKNVFRKEIKSRIMNEVENSECIHSIVFKVGNQYSNKEVRIFPRFKTKYECNGQRKRDNIEGDMHKILKEYGWVLYRNYVNR